MAIYHFSAKVIQRSHGRSAVAAAAYRAGEALHDEMLGRTFNYLDKPGIVHSEILLPEGTPPRWLDRSTLWNEVEAVERRKDAVLAREIELALPRELSQPAAIALARDFVREQFVAHGMVADLNVHWGRSADGEAQPHAHVMLAMRHVAPGPAGLPEEGAFGLKERAWNDKALLRTWRARWAELVNERLAEAGVDGRVDHRSYAARGIDLEPQNKIGPAGARRAVRGEDAERADEHRAVARRNGERLLAAPELALEALTRQQSTFTRADLARLVHRHSDGAEQFAAVMAKIEASPELVRVGHDGRGRERFSTREMLGIEQRMEATALELSRRTSHAVDVGRRRAALADGGLAAGGLGEEQRLAFGHATRSRDLAVVVGYAGTGKSTMLGAARHAWEAEGYAVRGAALSGIAAEGLEAGSGIVSRTIASWEHAWAQGREMLGPRDVLVLDEAGMVGSRQMDGVLTAVRQAGAKLVLVGDQEQLQAIEAGAAFRAIAERVGAAEITEVRRQRAAWQRDATRELATGRTGEALARYQAGGMSHAHATDEAARAALIAGWQAARERAPQESQVILAHTRDDVRALNDQARSVRRAAGELGEDRVLPTELGPRAFAAGDRIYFLRNERGLGGASAAGGAGGPGSSGRAGGTAVKNGSLGTILSIEGEGEGARLSVRLDRDDRADGKARVVTFGLAEYAHLDHGYAATVHKAQGATVDRAHVLATPGMDRHLAYVALSRHRQAVALHWSEESFGSAAELAARLGRERAKDTTLDYGESAPELAAAFAARRGLDPLRPASEIAVREDGPQPFTARGRARRARLAPALLSAMSTLGEAAELQAEAAERLGRLAADRKPAAEPPVQHLYADTDLGVFERILAARSLRESVVGDRPARPDREQLSQAEIFTEFTPMLDAAYQPPSEPMLPAVPYRPVEDEEVAAAVDADKSVRSAREDLGSALGRVYRDPVKAEHRLLALEAEGGAKAAAERLLKRPALLGQLHKQGGLFGGGRTAAFVIATLNAPSIGPRLVELRKAEARVGYAYRTEAEIRRRREAHAVPALSERARADIDALARAGAAPGNLGLAFWEGREPTAAEIRDAALLAPVWAAVTRDARVGAELTRFMDAANRRLGPEPAASPSDAETAARRLAGVIRSGQSLADKHPVFEAYAAAEPQRRAAAQAAREAEQRAAERAAEEARAKAAEKAETDLRYREFLRGRRSAPSSGPGMG